MKINEVLTETTVNEYDRPQQAVNTSASRPGRKTWKLTDLIDVTPRDGKDPTSLLNYSFKKLTAVPELQQPGIYIWSTPDVGIFYVGINGVDKGLKQRASAHIDKILGRPRGAPNTFPQNWRKLSQAMVKHSKEDSSKVQDDLDSIHISYIPIPTATKQDLEKKEKRFIKYLNPYANKQHDPNIPSSTRLQH